MSYIMDEPQGDMGDKDSELTAYQAMTLAHGYKCERDDLKQEREALMARLGAMLIAIEDVRRAVKHDVHLNPYLKEIYNKRLDVIFDAGKAAQS